MSTEPNLRMLFDQYHSGFDNYGAWYKHHKAMHAKHPLDCVEFGAEWLRRWEAVERLLRVDSQTYASFDGKWLEVAAHPLGAAICICIRLNEGDKGKRRYDQPMGRRIILLDGTIIREWPAKDDYDDIF